MERVLLWCSVLLSVTIFCHGRCESVYERGVSSRESAIIVDAHNRIRHQIAQGKLPGQPRGKGFKKIKYDKTLAAAAQRIANTCEFAHKKVTDERWPAVGQNLYTSLSTNYQKGADWNSAVQAWIDEHKKYSYGDPFNSATGHYTQVVWANTEYVGCGYTTYAVPGIFKYQKLYVCNYGPAGNYVGQVPYQT